MENNKKALKALNELNDLFLSNPEQFEDEEEYINKRYDIIESALKALSKQDVVEPTDDTEYTEREQTSAFEVAGEILGDVEFKTPQDEIKAMEQIASYVLQIKSTPSVSIGDVEKELISLLTEIMEGTSVSAMGHLYKNGKGIRQRVAELLQKIKTK